MRRAGPESGRVTGGGRARAPALGALAALIVLLALAGLGPAEAGASYALRPVANFNAPIYVTHAPGSPHLLFVVEQDGRIQIVRRGHKIGHAFLDIHRRVARFGAEQGLLGLAFDPRYERNRRFYVYYNTDSRCSGGACDIQVDGFRTRAGDPTRARRGSRHRVIVIRHRQAPNHNGGTIAFGPGRHLYLAPGDGGTQGDPENDAQRKNSLLGKVLRIDPRRHGGYSVPPGNPFVGRPGRNEIFARGLRNPYRFSFDSKTHDLWIGDVGYQTWEEIDHRARPRGANFGWHVYEGPNPCSLCGFGPNAPKPPRYARPVSWYSHANGRCAITGGVVVRDPSLIGLRGFYLYADYCQGRLRDLKASDPSRSKPLGLSVSQPAAIAEGAGHRVYVVSRAGTVYRLARV